MDLETGLGRQLVDVGVEQVVLKVDLLEQHAGVYQANLFHTKMLIKDVDLQNYLFNTDVYELPPTTRLAITESLRREMIDIFSSRNVY